MVVDVKAKCDNIALVSDSMPVTVYLVPKSDTTFIDRLYGGTVEFTKAPNGKVTGILWKLSKENKAPKIE